MEHILKVSGQYIYFLWSFRDFRNNVVVMGVVVGDSLLRGVAVVAARAFTESFRSTSLFSVEL